MPLGLAVGPLVAIGLARFAYALLLPAMRAGLDWSYAEAGTMKAASSRDRAAGTQTHTPPGGGARSGSSDNAREKSSFTRHARIFELSITECHIS